MAVNGVQSPRRCVAHHDLPVLPDHNSSNDDTIASFLPGAHVSLENAVMLEEAPLNSFIMSRAQQWQL